MQLETFVTLSLVSSLFQDRPSTAAWIINLLLLLFPVVVKLNKKNMPFIS